MRGTLGLERVRSCACRVVRAYTRDVNACGGIVRRPHVRRDARSVRRGERLASAERVADGGERAHARGRVQREGREVRGVERSGVRGGEWACAHGAAGSDADAADASCPSGVSLSDAPGASGACASAGAAAAALASMLATRCA
jgi:hypothetical protein